MKCVDTPVLLDLLHGGRAARAFLRALGDEEIATTEINLWELGLLARQDPRAGRERRLEAIERLRRGLLVLPVDARSTAAAIRLSGLPAARDLAAISLLAAGVLEAHGCTRWVTTREVTSARSIGPVEVEQYGIKRTKHVK